MATEAAHRCSTPRWTPSGCPSSARLMTAEDPRNGSMYNPVVLAAGVPI